MSADVLTGPARAVHVGLLALGYRPGAPGHVGPPALAIDRQCAAETECERCGHDGGLSFEPYHRGRSYKGLALCPVCGHALEV